MSEHQSLDQLRAKSEPLHSYVNRKIKHIKSVSWYRVTGIHFKEDDMSIWFSYETLHRHPVSFLRPITELLDGRFEL